MSGENWKETLTELRSAMGTAPAATPAAPKTEGTGASVPKMEPEEIQKLIGDVQGFLSRIESVRPRLESMQKAPGKVGDSIRTALRMIQGFSGPLGKFTKELRRALEGLTPSP